jgi:hypothetical protein
VRGTIINDTKERRASMSVDISEWRNSRTVMRGSAGDLSTPEVFISSLSPLLFFFLFFCIIIFVLLFILSFFSFF